MEAVEAGEGVVAVKKNLKLYIKSHYLPVNTKMSKLLEAHSRPEILPEHKPK